MNAHFPRPASDLEKTLPHRPPFVWIDEVTSVESDRGVCAVILKNEAHYMGPDGLRRSSYLEFMAQSFGYIRAAQAAMGLFPERPIPKKVFLVSIQDALYAASDSALLPSANSRLSIEVGGIREIGPITLFSATVRGPDGATLVQARLKVFSE